MTDRISAKLYASGNTVHCRNCDLALAEWENLEDITEWASVKRSRYWVDETRDDLIDADVYLFEYSCPRCGHLLNVDVGVDMAQISGKRWISHEK